jgi:ATP-dependent helicase/nuclease subunit A
VNAPRKSPQDSAARTRAATDFATNLVVSAGAGTGKTTLLVERVLTAIGSGFAPLSTIAAITFTEKAAGELRHRLSAGLAQLRRLAAGGGDEASPAATSAYSSLTGAKGVDPAMIARRAAEAEDSLDRATVTTIHGFCADILRGHPLAAGLPPGFTVDRGLSGRRFAAEEWAGFLEDELGPSGRHAELWARLLHGFDLVALQEIGRVLAGGAISEKVLHAEPAAFDLRAALGVAARRLAEDVRAAVARTDGLTGAPRAWLMDAARALDVFSGDSASAALAVIEGSERLGRAMGNVHTKKVAEADALALDALEERVRPFLKGLATYDARAEADLFEALLPFARRLRARQASAGLVDFDGLLVRARDLLRDELSVRASLKRRFQLILVDEFQDTDPIQYEIVFFLAERIGDEARDAYATRLVPGRLFIVGDAKQSIYRFRGADYAAYQRAVSHVLDQEGEELTLSSNFRSTASVLGPINALFTPPGSLLWSASAYLPPYVPIHAERDDELAGAVEVWTAADGPRTAAERRSAEGRTLAGELATLAGPGRPWRYADVLILFRGFSDLSPYLRALRGASIPFVVSGGRTFFDRTEIVQAMAVLRAVADPEDPVARLAYRRSPAGGVSDTALFSEAVGENAERASWAGADARLESLRAASSRLPVDDAISHVLEASGLVALSALAFEGAQRVANLEKLQLAARELARDGRRTLTETLDALEEGFESDEEGDSPLADETRDAVRVMSIHKAKGLESRIVILADAAAGRANRPPKGATARMGRFDNGEWVQLDGPAFRSGAAVAASIEEGQHKAAEDVRLLYVALTRARDRLIVFGGGDGKTAWSEAIADWTHGVTHRVIGEAEPVSKTADPPPIGAPAAAMRFDAAAQAVLDRSAPSFRSPSGTGDDASQPPAERTRDRALAREVGRIVHARLAGIDVHAVGQASVEAESILTAFSGSALAARLASLPVLGREIPMLLADDHTRWSGAIDLLFRDTDGTIVVADFKTDASDAGAVKRHGEQLRIYARAVRRALPGERVRAELWMLRTGTVLEVE